ncbi:predicted protein [Methanosarcina acetivorans C2A]|uniref:Uncharacterized protein n=1 Tax=Methanosarcina acetivorans (strain ATCC 35395 / DSM 2834 / JCM 12185 / C2A) TaxID=188937 RepID=Q8THI6_METAC|nr:predicted protein [Methanosarcina acetivorans C2A]
MVIECFNEFPDLFTMRFFPVYFSSSCSCCRNDPKAFHDFHFCRGDKRTIAEQKPTQNGFWSFYLYFFFHILDLLFLYWGFLPIAGCPESYYRVLIYKDFSGGGRIARSDKKSIKNGLKLSGFRKKKIKFRIEAEIRRFRFIESSYSPWKKDTEPSKLTKKIIQKTYSKRQCSENSV